MDHTQQAIIDEVKLCSSSLLTSIGDFSCRFWGRLCIRGLVLTLALSSTGIVQAKHDRIANPSSIILSIPAQTEGLEIDGKLTLSEYISRYKTLGPCKWVMSTYLKDLDGDRKPELIMEEFTGGAHCCNEMAIFRNTFGKTYEFVKAFVSQDVSINKDGTICKSVSPDYFHTCYACYIHFPAPGVSVSARYRFHHGKFWLAPRTQKHNRQIAAALRYLAGRGVPAEIKGMDDGTRKAFASMIIAYFYYNYDGNGARRLFDRYYHASDKATIWKDIEPQLILDAPIMK